jgi:hypothetical protein
MEQHVMNTKIFALLVFFALPAVVRAQTPDADAWKSRTTVSFSPLGMLYGTYNPELEWAFHRSFSVYIGPVFLNGRFATADGELAISGFAIGPGLRWFPGGRSPDGFWVGTEIGPGWTRQTLNGVPQSEGFDLSVGGMVGYNWVLFEHFYISPGAGVGVILPPEEPAFAFFPGQPLQINPILRLGVGYSF